MSLSCEEYEIKPYFYILNLAMSGVRFRERSLTMKYCRLHTPSDKHFLKQAFVCPSCQNDNEGTQYFDQLSHWRSCLRYAFLRESRDLTDDYQLTQYYSEILKLRASELEQ